MDDPVARGNKVLSILAEVEKTLPPDLEEPQPADSEE
jgi:hypothetical protein